MQKIKLLIPILIISILLCGCYDSREIDETAYIIALGIDADSDSSYTYTFQIANPLKISGGEESSSESSPDTSVQNFVVSSPDFYLAKNNLNNFLSKNVDMSHLKLIVFSKNLKNSQFLHHSQFLMTERQVRPHTNVAISTDPAESFIKSVSPTLESNTAKYYELMALHSDNLYAPSATISSFLDKLSTNSAAVLPLAWSKTSENKSKDLSDDFWIDSDDTTLKNPHSALEGMAVFKDGEAVGFYGRDYALIYNILKAKIKTSTVTLKNPADKDSNLIFRLNIPKSAGYKLENKNNKYKITITQHLDIRFLGNFLPEGFKTETELFNFAKQAITQKFTDFIYDLSRTKKADILDIGYHIKEQSAPLDKWQNIFETTDYEVNIF